MKYTLKNPLRLHYDLTSGKFFEAIPNRNQGGKVYEFVSKEICEEVVKAADELLALLKEKEAAHG